MVRSAVRSTARTGRFVATGFALGLSQMVNVWGAPTYRPPVHRTAADALRGDWEKLGGDMRKAVETVSPHGKR